MRQKIALSFCLVLAAGCASTAAAKKEVVWPDPPEIARIRFVMAIRTGDDLELTGLTRLKRILFGGAPGAMFKQPMGAAVSDDGKRLYVSDHAANAVIVADFDAKTLTRFSPDEPLSRAFGVALDQDENVYITDSSAKVVRVFDRGGNRLRQIGTNQLDRPTGIAIDRARKLLYVSDSSRRHLDTHRVRVFDLEGKWLRDLGAKPGRPSKGGGEGQWHFPTYIAISPEGNAFVSDSMNFRIQVFSPDGTFVRAYGENGDDPGAFARLKGLAFDGFGNLYAVDGGHGNVQIFNKDFAVLMFFGGYSQRLEYFDVPSGIAIHRETNRIYVCNEAIGRINVYELINTTAEDSNVPAPKPNP